MLGAVGSLPRSPARDLLGITDAGIALDIDAAAVLKLRRTEDARWRRRDEDLAKMIAIQLSRVLNTSPNDKIELPDVFSNKEDNATETPDDWDTQE
jgi:hypothetical protein